MKNSQMRDLTPEELDQLDRDTRRELFNLRIQKKTGRLENPARLRQVRRQQARVLTISKERKEKKV